LKERTWLIVWLAEYAKYPHFEGDGLADQACARSGQCAVYSLYDSEPEVTFIDTLGRGVEDLDFARVRAAVHAGDQSLEEGEFGAAQISRGEL
jgi:hypothetical protein